MCQNATFSPLKSVGKLEIPAHLHNSSGYQINTHLKRFNLPACPNHVDSNLWDEMKNNQISSDLVLSRCLCFCVFCVLML